MTEPARSPFFRSGGDLPLQSPGSTEEATATIREAAATGQAVLVRGSGSKWSAGRLPTSNALILSTIGLSGIIEYDPGELTLTAKAGTPLAEVESALAKNGQYLPFDPPFARFGATLGGTVAAGLSGPRRLRYGGLRDFIIGIQYLNAEGVVIRAGGKVVKNAAGYDFPKLFCGSLGTLGIIIEVSFKVFPLPQERRTLLASLSSATAVQAVLRAILHSRIEISAADAWHTGLLPTDRFPDVYTLAVQIDGTSQSMTPRLRALQALLPPGTTTHILGAEADAKFWEVLRDLAWLDDTQIVMRLYLPPNRLAAVDSLLTGEGARCAFSMAGNTGWAMLTGDPGRLSAGLAKLETKAMIWRAAQPGQEIIPALPGQAMVMRIKRAFDPHELFYPGRYAIE